MDNVSLLILRDHVSALLFEIFVMPSPSSTLADQLERLGRLRTICALSRAQQITISVPFVGRIDYHDPTPNVEVASAIRNCVVEMLHLCAGRDITLRLYLHPNPLLPASIQEITALLPVLPIRRVRQLSVATVSGIQQDQVAFDGIEDTIDALFASADCDLPICRPRVAPGTEWTVQLPSGQRVQAKLRSYLLAPLNAYAAFLRQNQFTDVIVTGDLPPSAPLYFPGASSLSLEHAVFQRMAEIPACTGAPTLQSLSVAVSVTSDLAVLAGVVGKLPGLKRLHADISHPGQHEVFSALIRACEARGCYLSLGWTSSACEASDLPLLGVLAAHLETLNWGLDSVDFGNCENVLAVPNAQSFTRLRSLRLHFDSALRHSVPAASGFFLYATRLLLNNHFPLLEDLEISSRHLPRSDLATIATIVQSPTLPSLATLTARVRATAKESQCGQQTACDDAARK